MKKMYAVAHNESGHYIGHGLFEEQQVIDGYYSTPESADAEAKRRGPFHYAFQVEVEEEEQAQPAQAKRDMTKEQKAKLGARCHKRHNCDKCPYYEGPDLMLDPRIDTDYNRGVIDRVKKCRDKLIADLSSMVCK